MVRDPMRAAETLEQLIAAQARFRAAQEERRLTILAAVEAGVSLRDAAVAAECSHESVRRIVAANGEVTLELGGDTYLLTGPQVEDLIYKLSGSARGAFPKDVARLGNGDGWLPAAGLLADSLQTAMSDEEGRSVALDQATGFALLQVLRLSFTNGGTTLAHLRAALGAIHGWPPR
jgi:hypothetical protein